MKQKLLFTLVNLFLLFTNFVSYFGNPHDHIRNVDFIRIFAIGLLGGILMIQVWGLIRNRSEKAS